MSCLNCDVNERGCKEKERENVGILAHVLRIKSNVM